LREQQAQPTAATPYLHVIVDASAGGNLTGLAARVRSLAESVPGVREVVLSAANFEMETVTAAPMPLAQIETVVRQIRLPRRGGFCRDRALKCALAWHATQAPTRPVVLAVIRNDDQHAMVADEDLASYALWQPAVQGYLEYGSGGAMRVLDFQHQPTTKLPGALTALQVDGKAVLVPLDGAEACLVPLPPATGGGVEITNERYRQAAAAWLRYANWLQQPAGREDARGRIVQASRTAHTLTPLTAFIVVENSAQWRMLEEKEKQKLGSQDQLEIQKAPEPATWLLLAGFTAWLLWRRRMPRDPAWL
jgi:hypothetical protein